MVQVFEHRVGNPSEWPLAPTLSPSDGERKITHNFERLLTLFALGALAQTNINSTAQPKRDGKVLVPDKPTSTDSANTATADQRPTRVERPPLSPEIQARIASFKEAARIYLEKEQALQKQIKGANDKERSALREPTQGLARAVARTLQRDAQRI
jgi:hypothetical protein